MGGSSPVAAQRQELRIEKIRTGRRSSPFHPGSAGSNLLPPNLQLLRGSAYF
jgi:hypothetical protein